MQSSWSQLNLYISHNPGSPIRQLALRLECAQSKYSDDFLGGENLSEIILSSALRPSH